MANTYELISSYTVGAGGISPIEFTAIPQTFNDLLIKFAPRNDAQVFGRLTFNGLASSYVRGETINVNGSISAAGPIANNDYTLWSTYPSSLALTFGSTEIYIPNYSVSGDTHIAGIVSTTENNAAASLYYYAMIAFAGSDTSAITSIELISHNSPSNKWAQYTSAELYGIKTT